MILRISALCVFLTVTLAIDTDAQQPIPLDTVRANAGSRLATAAFVTRSVDIIQRADIEALGARTVADVIKRALGVDVQSRSPAQADVSIRGSSFEQVLVMVDGIAVNDDQTGHFHLDVAVPLDAIERIEVLRGPASALYGSAAIGGVINIVTRRGTPELGARLQGGSHESIAGAVEAAATARNHMHTRISVEHDRSDGHRDGTDHKITQARIAFDAPLARGAVRADVAHAIRDFGANGFYAPFNSYEETRTTTAALSWRSRTTGTKELSLEPRISFRQHEDDFILRRDNPAFYHNMHTNRQLAAELVARLTLNDGMRVALGGEGARSDLDSNSLGERVEDRLAVFGEVVATGARGSTVTAGARVDRHSTFGTFVSPTLAAALNVATRLKLRGSAGSGFRAPSWTERYYQDPANIGNPELKPERFWTVEVGGAIAARDNITLDLAVFVRQADELIDWGRPAGASTGAPWRTLNVESATFRGLETSIRADFRPVELSARAALLDLEAEEIEGFTSKYALRPLTHALSLEAAIPLIAKNTKLTLRASDYRREGADGDHWSLLDARLNTHLRGVQIFADATNILDESYLDVSVARGPGRAFALGVRVRR